jgi:hypothetical protein
MVRAAFGGSLSLTWLLGRVVSQAYPSRSVAQEVKREESGLVAGGVPPEIPA